MSSDSSLLWQVIATIIGVTLQATIAFFGWRYTAKNTRDTLDIQQLVSNRATASFIAEKRQKWIDELRADMAFYLSLSQEIIWKWDAIRTSTSQKVEQEANGDQHKAMEIAQSITDVFGQENGARDREHQERHIRIKFRLNPEESLHMQLRNYLDEIRNLLVKNQSNANPEYIMRMKSLIESATETTEKVLKEEWTRLKQEVAYPDALMRTISRPKEDI
ncbi:MULTISPECIES: hypothetical protein [Klebsiella]|uniref:Uncharacterized protein n=1 Tax=Klebsiella michiganensis TaxID=1134687 RepID=A0A6P1UV10_9ENTR|nr:MULTISPECIES: hypothetical protein [Klebsiella]VAR65141.1 Uncharacterised protein [Klebsiella pneumoniae]HBR0756283.1 hypothetical protein [Klebsiella quasipneumoniae]HBZ6191128.1 hypothetical protein [Klebsiella variicola]MCJ1859569.1 hypothetical protein [Klebsiella quasipneumoniae subsp. similipneumoniae]QHS45778.1 hypothetical protein GW952_09310 [Klebsiella michiganensis]